MAITRTPEELTKFGNELREIIATLQGMLHEFISDKFDRQLCLSMSRQAFDIADKLSPLPGSLEYERQLDAEQERLLATAKEKLAVAIDENTSKKPRCLH